MDSQGRDTPHRADNSVLDLIHLGESVGEER